MTTMLYSEKEQVIVVDGRCTRGNDIVTDKYNKVIVRDDGIKFVVAGKCADLEALVSSYPYGFEGMTELEAIALVIDEGKVYECTISDGAYNIVHVDYDTANGSGAPYALASLDHGKTAKQAIKYAMTRDSATGGKIQVVKVK
jgi:20S proteasome alpha/beta subunit